MWTSFLHLIHVPYIRLKFERAEFRVKSTQRESNERNFMFIILYFIYFYDKQLETTEYRYKE